VTHPEFKVRRPGNSYFRLDILVTSQGVPFIAKKVCHHNQVAKFRVAINLTLMAMAIRMAVDSFQISLRRNVPHNNTVKQGQISRYVFWATVWKTDKSANSDRRKIFNCSSIMSVKHLQTINLISNEYEGPFHEIKRLRLRLRRLFFF